MGTHRRIVRNAAGAPVVIAPVATLAGKRLAYRRNINEATDDTIIYGPYTPGDRILSVRADFRA